MEDKGEQNKADDITNVLKRILLEKSEAGEYIEIEGERLIVSREECPPLLLSANKNIPEIILVQQYSQLGKKLISPPPVRDTSAVCTSSARNGKTPLKTQSINDDLDVTGSPLKCPFMQDIGDTDLSPFTITVPTNKKKMDHQLAYTPVSSSKSGLIASKFNLAASKMSECKDSFVPLWVVCDGKDKQGTLFIGMHRAEGRLSRTLVTTAGPYQGRDSLPSFDHLIHHHTAVGPVKRVDSVVKATYDVLTSEDEDKGSSLNLICNWKRPLTVLSPPAPDSHTTASVRVVCDDGRSAAHQMYQELSVLRGFVAGLRSGEVAWFSREGTTSVAQDLQEVFSSIKDKGQRQKRDEDVRNDFDTMIEGKFFNRRQNMDFTDYLWNCLMRCESYQMLKESLGLVFMAVTSEEVRPQIHVCNTTQVGMLLRNLMRGKECVPEFSGLTPLHMLIEMGCEKIKRDYINIFQNGELATGEQLSWFVNGSNSGVAGDMMHEVSVKQLGRLHVALQVVVALRTYLSLPPSSLSHFTAQILSQMKEVEPGLSHSFSLKLETFSVLQLLNSLKVNTWEVCLSSSQGSFSKSLVGHISHTPLIQLASTIEQDDDVEKDKDNDDDKEEEYYCTYFSSITDNYFV